MASGSRAVSFLAARIDGIAHGCEVERRWPAGNNDQIDHLSYNAVHPGRILCATNLFVRAPLHEVAGVPWAPRTFAPIRSTWPPFSCSRTQPRRPLHKVVLDLHRNRGANTRKGVDHQPDPRPVAQAGQGIGVDRIDQGPGFVRLQHRRLATPLRVLGPRTAWARSSPTTSSHPPSTGSCTTPPPPSTSRARCVPGKRHSRLQILEWTRDADGSLFLPYRILRR
jgi:hypothetical protein